MRRDFVVDLLPNPPQYESPKHHLRCPPTFLGLLCDTDCAIDSPMLVTLHRKEDGLNCSWDNTIGTGLSPLTQLLEVQNGLCFPFHFLQNPFKLLQNQPGMDSISTFSATITRPSLSKVALLTSFSDFCSNHPTRNTTNRWFLWFSASHNHNTPWSVQIMGWQLDIRAAVARHNSISLFS